MTEVAVREGYAVLTVERVLDSASVSRATFYQYFSSLDDCFWSAYREHAEQLVSDVTAAVRGSRHGELAVLDALVAAATSRPDRARLLMREGLAAGPTGLSQRDALISRLEHAIAGAAPTRSPVDLPTAILIGGTFRFLVMRLADDDPLDDLRDELREWVSAFERRSSRPSWSARLAPALPREPSRSPAQSSGARPLGGSRERILHATAATVGEKGYKAMTITDVIAAAGVSRRLFYNEFASKSAAFTAAYEHMFQRTIATCAPAFFGSLEWPERIWQSAQAFTNFILREPLFAYLGFVECYALGPAFLPRVHDTQLAFTLFLEEGYRQRPQAASLSRSCASLSQAAAFEVGFQACRRGVSLYIRPLQPLAVYIALAPFIGLDDAGAFVMGKLSERASPDSVLA